jgi:hypothetical protein
MEGAGNTFRGQLPSAFRPETFWFLMGVKRAGWNFWNGGRQSVPSAEQRESAKRDVETAEPDVQSAKGKNPCELTGTECAHAPTADAGEKQKTESRNQTTGHE